MSVRNIDCLFIGSNYIPLEETEKLMRLAGSGSYREFNFEFVQHNKKLYSLSELYNKFRYGTDDITVGSIFSATIAYLATYLHRRGLTFDYVNSFKEEKEELIEMLRTCNIQTIAIPTTLYVTLQPILEIVSFVRKYNNTAKIIIGGPFIFNLLIDNNDADEVANVFDRINADFYIYCAQGEMALVNLINRIKSNSNSFEDIENLFYKQEGKYVKTANVNENNNLEDNMVDWTLFRHKMKKSILVRTSISCPFACSYCEYPIRNGKYRTAGVDAIERELNTIEQIDSIKNVYFIDDTLNFPPQRFKDILRMMIKNKYKFKWGSFFRCQFADREMIELMKESGCIMLFLGIESGNQMILNRMNKCATLDVFRKGLELINEFDIPSTASFVVGFPGETEETIQETIQFIEETKPTFYAMNLWYFSKFSAIANQRDIYGLKGSEYGWSHDTMDCGTAVSLMEKMMLSVKNSIHLPKYNFDNTGILNLFNQGMSIEQVKNLVNAFNEGIRHKLLSPSDAVFSDLLIDEMKKQFPVSK